MFRPHLRKSRRFLLVTALVAAVALVFAAAAYAVGSSVSPASQGAQGGTYVNWTGRWSGTPNFTVDFFFGDGSSPAHVPPTNQTSSPFSHPFYPCFETTYTQKLKVTDALGLQSTSQSQTIVQPGNIC